jgi:hypothetical protein
LTHRLSRIPAPGPADRFAAIETALDHECKQKEPPMFKPLVLAALFALSLGASVASFATPAHAAFDAYMTFSDGHDW